MHDIETRADIDELVGAFYDKAMRDEMIGYLFTEVARIDLAAHLPVIADFWEMILFRTINFQEKYGRSPMATHGALNEKEPLRRAHFTRWLRLFAETVDERFNGPTAELAKMRAVSIAHTMVLKFTQEKTEGAPA